MNQEIVDLLRRNNELLMILAKSALAGVVQRELGDAKNRKLYELTGGELTVKQISQKIGLAVGKISQTWQRWEQLGLLVKDGRQYRRALG